MAPFPRARSPRGVDHSCPYCRCWSLLYSTYRDHQALAGIAGDWLVLWWGMFEVFGGEISSKSDFIVSAWSDGLVSIANVEESTWLTWKSYVGSTLGPLMIALDTRSMLAPSGTSETYVCELRRRPCIDVDAWTDKLISVVHAKKVDRLPTCKRAARHVDMVVFVLGSAGTAVQCIGVAPVRLPTVWAAVAVLCCPRGRQANASNKMRRLTCFVSNPLPCDLRVIRLVRYCPSAIGLSEQSGNSGGYSSAVQSDPRGLTSWSC